MLEKTVKPRYLEYRNIPIWNNMFGVGIHFDCGECGFSQNARIPLRDYHVVECKHCMVLNKIPIVTTTYADC